MFYCGIDHNEAVIAGNDIRHVKLMHTQTRTRAHTHNVTSELYQHTPPVRQQDVSWLQVPWHARWRSNKSDSIHRSRVNWRLGDNLVTHKGRRRLSIFYMHDMLDGIEASPNDTTVTETCLHCK